MGVQPVTAIVAAESQATATILRTRATDLILRFLARSGIPVSKVLPDPGDRPGRQGTIRLRSINVAQSNHSGGITARLDL